MGGIVGVVVIVLIIAGVIAATIAIIYLQTRKNYREQKNYERSLKMVPVRIHLPPQSDDIKSESRDARDVVDETVSQAQTMYNVISSTATKGFKSNFYGQRHISFEIVAHGGSIHYYVVVPTVLLDTIKQAVIAAYPTARLEEVEEINLFSEVGKITGTIGGEFTLKKPYEFPIATYQESRRNAMRAILSALSTSNREDGAGVQIMIRPAGSEWVKTIEKRVKDIKAHKKGASSGKSGFLGGLDVGYFAEALEALWKPPNVSTKDGSGSPADKPLSGTDQAKVEALEEKTKYSGYETLIRVVASSSTVARSQVLMNNIVSAFAMFDSPTKNGFSFAPARNIETFVTSYIFRFFPQEIRSNILNTVELATIFHLPDQTNIPSSMVKRQAFKQVDGPSEELSEGLLVGNNVFRGVVKPIRISTDDRRRHLYIMGSTGMGKSVLLENLALQDMLSGRGFAFVDPHGDAVEHILGMIPKERVEDIIYFNPSDIDNPIGMNLLEVEADDPDPDSTKDFLVGEIMNMMYSLYDPGRTGIVGPRMENIVRNAALLLMADPKGGTFMDIPKILVDPEFAKSKLPYLKNARALDFWTKEWPNAQRSNDAGEVTSWVVSKWASFENVVLTNILGQLKSGLNIREIMDNRKILLVNLSKGKLGEMAAKLLGMMFVMKFQQAAMSRANIPESERQDFTLYVDEFQNFATDSFESILSEARKYRLSLVVANQFMSQLTDKIRPAIMGNVGSYIIGRVGFEDAEQVVKIFAPVFDQQDLQFMPNHTAVSKVLVAGMPSQPFSMNLLAPMGKPNRELTDAMAKLSASKYGRPRAVVEAEIKNRLQAADIAKAEDKRRRLEAMRNSSIPVPGKSQSQQSSMQPATSPAPSGGDKSAFVDNWLTKRTQVSASPSKSSKKKPKPTQDQNPPTPIPVAPDPKNAEPPQLEKLSTEVQNNDATQPSVENSLDQSTSPISAPTISTQASSDSALKPEENPVAQNEQNNDSIPPPPPPPSPQDGLRVTGSDGSEVHFSLRD